MGCEVTYLRCGAPLWAVAAYLIQALAGIDWGPLSAWQGDEPYRRWSGLALVLMIGAQWWIALARRAASAERARALRRWHRRVGGFALVGLFAHSTRLGFGYLMVLGLLLASQVTVGALRPAGSDPALQRLRGVWIRVHVVQAILLVVGAVFHVWMVFAYC